MKLTTTLNKIRDNSPCSRGWTTLNKALGLDFNSEQEINLLTILETNGVQDMLWCLRATHQDSRKIASQLAIEFAMKSLDIFESNYPSDQRPRKTIQGTKDYINGLITKEELSALRDEMCDSEELSALKECQHVNTAYHAADCAYYSTVSSSHRIYVSLASQSVYHAAYYAKHANDTKTAIEQQKEIIKMILSD